MKKEQPPKAAKKAYADAVRAGDVDAYNRVLAENPGHVWGDLYEGFTDSQKEWTRDKWREAPEK